MSIVKKRSKVNLCEYFVIVSYDFSHNTSTENIGNNTEFDPPAIELCQDQSKGLRATTEATILDQYPSTTPNKLPEGIEFFCFPTGIKISEKAVYPTFHSFVHTSDDGSRMIGSVLVFSEEMDTEQLQYFETRGIHSSSAANNKLFVQKGICLLSHYPFITAFKSFLKTLYKLSKNAQCPIPLERYICNFVDDVPAPPPGKVDITYFIDDESITFRCPPSNEPNTWSGFPLFPLFECLDIDNICQLLALLLVERQVIFISSQYSLLTLCAEAMTSLLYPIRWIHAYIPILPSGLLGALGAPFPFIFGISAETYEQNVSLVGSETVRVFLDENRIEYGDLGLPPPLPERRHMKLKAHILETVPWYAHPEYHAKEENKVDSRFRRYWKKYRLARFDLAASDVADIPMPTLQVPSSSGSSTPTLDNSNRYKVEDAKIREGFLKFFVSIFKDYKRFLIYPSKDERGPADNFRFEDFLQSQPVEWQPFLREITKTQSFSQFVDERVVLTKLDQDVIFFDESIDAKYNRYTFRLHDIDTPFLLHNSDRHIKTYVPPSPHTVDIPLMSTFPYLKFPSKLNDHWLLPPRNLAANFSTSNVRLLSLLNKVRLKRKIIGGRISALLSSAACVYSSYLVALTQFISSSVELVSTAKSKPSSISTSKLLNEYNVSSDGRGRSNSLVRLLNPLDVSPNKKDSHSVAEVGEVLQAASLALKVAFEVMNCLSRLDYAPDEIAYRCVAEACADLKQTDSLLDLIVYMDEEGLVPDHQIRHALLRCLTSDLQKKQDINNATEGKAALNSSINSTATESMSASNCAENSGSVIKPYPAVTNSAKVIAIRSTLNPADIWTYQTWKLLRRDNAVLIMRSSVDQQVGGTIRGGEQESTLARFLFGSSHTSSSFSAINDPTRKVIPQLRDRWSANAIEGFVPKLQWDLAELQKELSGSAHNTPFAASNRLRRQVSLGETKLQIEFSGLSVDLSNKFGTKCPNENCPVQRCLSIGEIYQGWGASAGDLNKYTTTCVHCGKEFIPRFKLSFGDLQREAVWIEFLSPWVLHKELVNVVLEDGVSTLLSRRFRSDEKSTIFWNALIAFRLRGLPVAFMITNGSITDAFPPK